ncbi:unnamed protein product [Moneuplotes crassus]|uniref:Uncharacterized protein n=1 Tax=Euplotes crassus TaxID=5936 RepID=A0AAD1U875_EUPCR|nr:unnamed protein product [Moneuplotes crassus]
MSKLAKDIQRLNNTSQGSKREDDVIQRYRKTAKINPGLTDNFKYGHHHRIRDSTSVEASDTELLDSLLRSEQNLSHLQLEKLKRSQGSSLEMSHTLDKQLHKLTTGHRRAAMRQKQKRNHARKRSRGSGSKHSKIRKNTRKKRTHATSVPSYLRGTVSSALKRQSLDKDELKKSRDFVNIFFNKRMTDMPLTESELRDSNNKLMDSSFFRRSYSNNRLVPRYVNLVNNEMSDENMTNPEIQIFKTYNQEFLRENSCSQTGNSRSSHSHHRDMTELDIDNNEELCLKSLDPHSNLNSVEKKGTAQFHSLKKSNEDIMDIFDKPQTMVIEKGCQMSNSRYRARSSGTNHSRMSNSLEREPCGSKERLSLHRETLEGRRTSFKTSDHAFSTYKNFRKTSAELNSGVQTIVHQNQSLSPSKLSSTESMIYFKARKQLVQKEQEILRLKQTLHNQNSKEISKKILTAKLDENTTPNQQIIPTVPTTYKAYMKHKELQGLSEETLKQNQAEMKSKTAKILKKIPQSVLGSFHIPKYLRC